MKEARVITIFSIILLILSAVFAFLLYSQWPNLCDYVGITTNIICGVIVGLITSICQYCVQRRKIINEVYNNYFDIYRTYYYAKNNATFYCNSYSVYKKLIELFPKISSALDEYHGLLFKYDKTYKKLNPQIQLGEKYKIKNIRKSIFYLLNKKYFDLTVGQIIIDIENILNKINKKRFKIDKKQMIKMYNYIYCKKNKL